MHGNFHCKTTKVVPNNHVPSPPHVGYFLAFVWDSDNFGQLSVTTSKRIMNRKVTGALVALTLVQLTILLT